RHVVQAKLPGLRIDEAGERFQERAFAGAIGSDQPIELARLASKADLIEDEPVIETDRKCVGGKDHRGAPAPCRMGQKRNGAPRKAVTTPSISSGPLVERRMPISASVSSKAPPSALGRSSAPGRCATKGRTR